MKTTLLNLAACLCMLVTTAFFASAQTKGFIYKPALSSTARAVLDPNGDGYTSLTTSGFSGTNDYGSSYSELPMIALPVLAGETSGDIVTGATGGHTDLVSNSSTQSVSVLVKTVSGVQYLIIRFRIGKASTASKGYSLLLDADSDFGTYLTDNNPGYDREIILETGNPGSVKIYKHASAANGGVGQVLATYNADSVSQRSAAASANDGDADYFYEFCVPLSAIQATNYVRITAATITSAQSGITGTISDFNGVNDAVYSNPFTAMKDIINSFPSTVKLTDLVDGFSFPSLVTTPPVITNSLNASSTYVMGNSTEANGTTITVYRKRNGTTTALSPTTSVSSNSWTLSSGVSGNLSAGDTIYATATASGRSASSASNKVEVVATCYTPAPVISTRSTSGGTRNLQGSWRYADGTTPAASTVLLKLYRQTDNNTFSLITTTAQYVATDGTFDFNTGMTNTTFGDSSLALTATINGCESPFSNVSKKQNGTTGNVTATPTLVTTSIIASNSTSNARTITVKNNDAAAAYLILYKNGVQIATTAPATIATTASNNFSYPASNGDILADGDVIYARAQVPTGSTPYWLSNASTTVTVEANSTTTSRTPVITGSYTSGTGKTVSGYCDEYSGTAIYLFRNGTVIDTVYLDAYGKFSFTNETLNASDVLTAKSDAAGKLLSAASAGVTVLNGAASAPSAPTISTTTIVVGSTSTISGASGSGRVLLYLNGELFDSTSTNSINGSWSIDLTVHGTNTQLTKGSTITAKNWSPSTGLFSTASSGVIISGMSSFTVKNTSDGNIATQTAGSSFNIKLVAKDATNGGGNTFTSYTGSNLIVGTYTVTSGNTTSSFAAGILSSHAVTLTKAGTYTLTTLSVNDPTTTGISNSFTVNHAAANKLMINTQPSVNNTSNTAFSTQPVVYITDAYDNIITEDNSTQVTVTIASGTNGTLGGTVTKTAVNGIVTFTDLKITGGGTFTLRFADGSSAYTSVTSDKLYIGEVWIGTTSTAFATGSNWADGTSPASGASIAFDPSPSNHLILTANQTIGTFYNNSSKQLQVNGYKLTVTGSFNQNSGATIEASTSEIEMAGSAAQTVPASTFINNNVCRFTVNNSNGVTLGGTLNITCRLTPTSGTLTTGGNLVIASSATGDGVIDQGSGTIAGNVTVERYIPAKRAWRLLTAPLSNTGSIWSNWQNSGVYTAGTGILVSGPTAGQSNNGLDVTAQNTASLLTYDAVNNAWVDVSNTKTTNLSNATSSAANKAYLVFIRGDRDPNNAVLGAYNQTTLKPVGQVQSGNQTYNIENVLNRYTVIGNPYACPIDFDAVYNDASNSGSNIYRKFWFYDPNLNTIGGYVTVSWNGSSYDITPSGASHTRYIQSGQAFFVQTSTGGGSPTLTIKESHKSVSNVVQIFRPGTQLEKFVITLNQVNNNGTRTLMDEALANFSNNYSKNVGAEDAAKISNFNETIGLKRDGSNLAIEGLPLADAGDTLFLNFTKTQLKNYEFVIQPLYFNAPGLTAYLLDSYTNTSTPVSITSATTYQFTVTSAAGAWAADRFKIVFKSNSTLPVTFTSINAYAKNNGVQVEWNVANETGINTYDVQRSVDGINFYKIATVTANRSVAYNSFDAAPVKGVNYYRIKSVGSNGEPAYTPVVKVNIGTTEESAITVYPNPVKGNVFNLQVNGLDKGIYTLSIYNQQAQKVITQVISVNSGSYVQPVKLLKTLSKGIYRLELLNERQVKQTQIIIE